MELITIRKENETEVVSARELYDKLKIKWRFSTWIKRYINKDNDYGFVENEDYTPYVYIHPQNNQEVQDYLLTLDMAKELCMLSKSEKGIAIRKYFISCEKKYIQAMKEQLENKQHELEDEFSKDSCIKEIFENLKKAQELENQIDVLVTELGKIYKNIKEKSRMKENYFYETASFFKGRSSYLEIGNGKLKISQEL